MVPSSSENLKQGMVTVKMGVAPMVIAIMDIVRIEIVKMGVVPMVIAIMDIVHLHQHQHQHQPRLQPRLQPQQGQVVRLAH